MNQINVLIIEDDFRIAKIHQEVIEKEAIFQVMARCLTAKQAWAFLETASSLPDIILLDVYIPDVEGLELLERLKQTYPYTAIIIASAANDLETVQRAKLIGVFDYIMKPIEQERLQTAFHRFKKFISLEANDMTQQTLDRYFGYSTQEPVGKKMEQGSGVLPKGIDTLTLEEVKSFIEAYQEKEVTAQLLGESVGISRSTARRYLEYLVTLEVVHASLNYGQVGRPQRVYRFVEHNEQN